MLDFEMKPSQMGSFMRHCIVSFIFVCLFYKKLNAKLDIVKNTLNQEMKNNEDSDMQ